MKTQDVTTGCTGSDDAGEFRVETIVTNDASNGLQAVIRYTSGKGQGLPGWLTVYPERDAKLNPAPVLTPH